MAHKMSLPDWVEWQKKLGAKFKKAVVRGLDSGGARSVLYLQNETSKAGAFDRGGFKRGWRYQLVRDPMGVKIYNSTPYASVIEEGRRPNRRPPPSDALVPWVRRKLGVSRKEAKSVAYVVARAIGERGIPGKHILKTASANIAKLIVTEVQNELKVELYSRV